VDNVNTNQFGLVFICAVDDEIHTQPLIATNVTVSGKGTHNLVIVATVNDSIYAFDADDSTATASIWQTNLLNANAVPLRNTDIMFACLPYRDFAGKMGIVGTPVIDPATSTVYFVARTKEFSTNYVQRLCALDIRTGSEVPNGHVTIAFTNSTVFNPLIQNQRAALALVNGYVYITWSSHCDGGPYHGFVAAYRAADLSQPPITYNVTPSGSQAGIWMSDQAPPADISGNIYLSTGNGTWDGTNNFGESFLKLTNNGTALVRADWFTPYNWNSLNGVDADLGSGGVSLIPGTSLLFSGGKAGWLYLVNATNMGHISGSASADTNIVESWSWTPSQVHGGAVSGKKLVEYQSPCAAASGARRRKLGALSASVCSTTPEASPQAALALPRSSPRPLPLSPRLPATVHAALPPM